MSIFLLYLFSFFENSFCFQKMKTHTVKVYILSKMAFIGENTPAVTTFNRSLADFIIERFGGTSSTAESNCDGGKLANDGKLADDIHQHRNLFQTILSIVQGMDIMREMQIMQNAETVRCVCDAVEQRIAGYSEKNERIYTSFCAHVKQTINGIRSNVANYGDAEFVPLDRFCGFSSIHELAKDYNAVYKGEIPYKHLFPVGH